MHKLNDLQKATFMTFTVVDQNEKKGLFECNWQGECTKIENPELSVFYF